jgi:chloramphenicol-sensitive protein RarD
LSEQRSGLGAVLGSATIWGLTPVYFRALAPTPPLVIVGYRMVLSCLCVMAWLALRRELLPLRAALSEPRTRWRLLGSALLITGNWAAFVIAIDTGHLIESSLGYFIAPLVNVALGVSVLGEHLRRVQWLAVAMASSGVLYLAIMSGRPPWIALALAFTFGGYGLLRKTVAAAALTGLAAETLLILPLGVLYLGWVETHGAGALARAGSWQVQALLALSGVITAVPLWLFAYGARRVPLTTVGLAQYLGPTLQLVIGIFLFREPFDAARVLGFAIIWVGLVLYVVDGFRQVRQERAPARR